MIIFVANNEVECDAMLSAIFFSYKRVSTNKRGVDGGRRYENGGNNYDDDADDEDESESRLRIAPGSTGGGSPT